MKSKHTSLFAYIFTGSLALLLPLQTLAAPFADTYVWNDVGQSDPVLSTIGFSDSSVASNDDGSKLLYGYSGGRLFRSSDGGVTWTETQPAGNTTADWYAIASDDDGSNLIAADRGGRLYLSDDSGVSWSETQPAGDTDIDWSAVASDADGSVLVAAVDTGRMYLSTNSGGSWSETQPAGDVDAAWSAVGADADGSALYAAVDGGRVYVSTNGGGSWSETQPAGDVNTTWIDLAIDSDGSVAIVVDGTETYVSTTTGATWTTVGLVASRVAADADGSVLLAAYASTNLSEGRVYVSVDTGENWAETRPAGDSDELWNSLETDSDGSHVIAIHSIVTIFSSQAAYFGLSTPYLLSTTPANEATDVATDADITLTFSEAVSANAGNVTIYDASDDSIFEAIDVTTGAVTGSGTDTITVNPTADLEEETTYYILVDAGAFTADSNGAEFIGVNESSVWGFTTPDETAPTLSSFDPSDEAINISTHTNLEMTFSEDVVASSTGTITIKKTADDSTVQVIDVSGSDVNISGNDVVVGITVLEPETAYAIQISAGAFQDAAGNDYAGISDLTTWNFTTASGGSSSGGGSSSQRQAPPEELSSQSMGEHERILTLLVQVLQQLIELLIEERSA